MQRLLSLFAWLVVSFLPAAVGGVAGPDSWYRALAKPSWNPPNWIFAPAWTLLYALMGIAAWLVWRQRGSKPVMTAIVIFLVQLALNAAWSWIFFGLHQPGWALAEILVMWAAIAATIVAFWMVRPLAGALLLPYLAWVSFASALTGAIWALNR